MRAALMPLNALPIVGDIRIIGGVGVVELVNDKSSRRTDGYLDGIGPRLAAAFLERGLLLRPLGLRPRHLDPLHCEYAIVDSSASSAWRESRRVCWTMIGSSDSMTLE